MPISAFDVFGRSHRSRFVVCVLLLCFSFSFIAAHLCGHIEHMYTSGYGSTACQGFAKAKTQKQRNEKKKQNKIERKFFQRASLQGEIVYKANDDDYLVI